MDREHTVGVVGLGNMGSAMARSLREAGHDVVGYDVLPGPRSALEELGGHAAESPADVLARADRVILSLPNADALDAVLTGEGGLVEHALAGAVIAETSTLALEDKIRAHDLLEQSGMTLLDCPISGTGAQALARDIVFFASGQEPAYDRLAPVLLDMGREAPLLGEFGMGTKAKFLSNLMVSIHTMAAAEALNLAVQVGFEADQALALLSAGASASRMLTIRGPMMARDEFPGSSSTLRVLSKDVELIRKFANGVDVPTPLLSVVSDHFTAARAQGLSDADPAAVVRVLATLSPALEHDGSRPSDPGDDR